jgi:hypothetical protein
MQVLEQRASAHKAELNQERAATRRAESALAAERAQAVKLKEQASKWEGVAKVGTWWLVRYQCHMTSVTLSNDSVGMIA